MQIWGTGAFDNDAADVWVNKFDRAAGAARPVVVRAALSAVLDRHDQTGCFSALAAATTVAASLPGGALLARDQGPKALVDNAFTASPDLAALARAALERVGAPSSAWSQTWAGLERLDDALAVVYAVTDELEDRSTRDITVRAAS